MAIYIDSYNAKYKNMIMCHMIADSYKELFDFAERIGLKKSWFHKDHFDVCLEKKKLAISLGAIEVSTKDIILIRRKIKHELINLKI